MQKRDINVPQNISIIPLNPKTLSDETSHKSPAIIEKTALGITLSYMHTQTTRETIKAGFIEKISNKCGVVWIALSKSNNK